MRMLRKTPYYVRGIPQRFAEIPPHYVTTRRRRNRNRKTIDKPMTNTIRATLPYPPTVNHYWKVGRGRIYISPEGRQYRRRVVAILAGVPQFDGSVAIAIVACPPDRKVRDLDNVLKATLDALTQACLWDDDSQVGRLTIVRGPVVRGGCLEIGVESVVPEPTDG